MLYSVIYLKEPVAGWESWRDLTVQAFDAKNGSLFTSGFRLFSLNTYVDGSGLVRYAGEWVKSNLNMQATRGLTRQQHQSAMDTFKHDGYRPVWVSGCQAGGQDLLSTIYLKNNENLAWQARDGLNPNQHAQLAEQLKNQGYRPLCMSGYPAGNTTAFASVWVANPGESVAWKAFWQEPAAGLQNQFNQLSPQGYRPISISSYRVGPEIRYSAVWVHGGPPWVVHFGATNLQQLNAFNDLKSKGYRPICTVGVDEGAPPVVATQDPPAAHFPITTAEAQKQDGNTTASAWAKVSRQAAAGLIELHVHVKKTGVAGVGYASALVALLDGAGNTIYKTPGTVDVQAGANADIFSGLGGLFGGGGGGGPGVAEKDTEGDFNVPLPTLLRTRTVVVAVMANDNDGLPNSITDLTNSVNQLANLLKAGESAAQAAEGIAEAAVVIAAIVAA
jgi:hypothetical protein